MVYVNTQTNNKASKVIEVIFFPRTSGTIFFEGSCFMFWYIKHLLFIDGCVYFF